MEHEIQAIRKETVLQQNGTLTLDDLPFLAGDAVEVIVLQRTVLRETATLYALRGLPVTYHRPFDGVAETDWDAVS